MVAHKNSTLITQLLETDLLDTHDQESRDIGPVVLVSDCNNCDKKPHAN